jgi:1-deoxy-D-xylulose-5-phosphate synthase
MIVAAPADEIELRHLLYTASLGLDHPIAIRYPRGRGHIIDWEIPMQKLEIGKATSLKTGSKIALVSTGTIAHNVTEAIEAIEEKIGHYHFGFIKPLDIDLLKQIVQNYNTIITVEDGVIKGGFGSSILDFANQHHFKNNIITLGIPDQFIHHGTVAELQEICGISTKGILKVIKEYI